MSVRKGVSAITPADTNPLKITKVKSVAAGIPAATSSLFHGLKKMGAIKTVKTLTTVNQQEGFDCPGCAWPDPKHSSAFEFCENGAKAVADEAMKGGVNPNFFSKYTVQELSQKSDFWLNNQGRITNPMILKKDSDRYEKIDWNDAIQLIADNIKSSNNPNRSVFYTSGTDIKRGGFPLSTVC